VLSSVFLLTFLGVSYLLFFASDVVGVGVVGGCADGERCSIAFSSSCNI